MKEKEKMLYNYFSNYNYCGPIIFDPSVIIKNKIK